MRVAWKPYLFNRGLVHLLPGVWRDIHWRALLWLGLGCLLGTPFGVYALANVPAAPMTLALAIFVLVSAVLLARGYALKTMPGPAATFATGTASGLSLPRPRLASCRSCRRISTTRSG